MRAMVNSARVFDPLHPARGQQRLVHDARSERPVSLVLTLEAVDVLRARRAIFQTGGDSVAILKTAVVPHTSQVRLCVGMGAGALESVMTAIMRSIERAQFGRVTVA